MKRIVTVCGLLSALSYSGMAQMKDQAGQNVEQTVMRIEREMLNAILKGDPSASERYLASTYVFTGPDGTVEDKAQSIADLKSGDLKIQSASLDGAKVQLYDNTAVVTYGSRDKGTFKGKDISGNSRWTDVFVNRGGHWQIVATHGSMVPK
jgi:hypothetical protein